MSTLDAATRQGHRRVIDVAALPTDAFGNEGLVWWGTVGFMVIEGSMFVMAIIVYFYLRLKVQNWPPSLPDPNLLIPSINLLIVLVSAIPNALAKKAAESFDLGGTRVWLAVLTLIGVANVVLRGFEYGSLNCRWDDNAYASITWLLLSLHTIHIATDVVDTAVLTTLFWTGPVTKKRFVDASENSLYWYFIIAWWIPIYLVIYWAPRWL
jgi:heme/copper-type cytochrome/quinol oxidase subunit 3